MENYAALDGLNVQRVFEELEWESWRDLASAFCAWRAHARRHAPSRAFRDNRVDPVVTLYWRDRAFFDNGQGGAMQRTT